MVEINFLAILVAAGTYIVLGMLWWSPKLFGSQWIKLMGWGDKSKEEMDKMKKEAKSAYTVSAIMALITALFMAIFLEYLPITTWWCGPLTGIGIWVGFVGPATITNSMYSGKPNHKLWAINFGYHLVGLILIGLILGNWI
jgi:hypothetical protein